MTLGAMLAMSDEELARVDPVVMNLMIAKGIPALADLDIDHYVQQMDEWAGDLRSRLPGMEAEFRKTPQDWGNDIALFRLGAVCWYADVVLGVSYKDDQRGVTAVYYTDPAELFLNSIMDRREGNCGTMAFLHVVLGKRIGLPVSLACAGGHFICRYENGSTVHNVEATHTGHGSFATQPDAAILKRENLSPRAKECGSDLRAVTPREMLGIFVGCRARHLDNTTRLEEAEPDYLLARYLFPRNRALWIAQHRTSMYCGMERFEGFGLTDAPSYRGFLGDGSLGDG